SDRVGTRIRRYHRSPSIRLSVADIVVVFYQLLSAWSSLPLHGMSICSVSHRLYLSASGAVYRVPRLCQRWLPTGGSPVGVFPGLGLARGRARVGEESRPVVVDRLPQR